MAIRRCVKIVACKKVIVYPSTIPIMSFECISENCQEFIVTEFFHAVAFV